MTVFAAHTPAALQRWIERTQHTSPPGFFVTVQDILRLTESSRSSATDLARVILRDPALTTSLLRAANSFYANPLGHPITTVSRAITLIGFKVVRYMAITASLIDDCLQGPMRTHLVHDLARCFHAAVQARALARLINAPEPEEIYIAALLHSLGSVVFWSSDDETRMTLDQALLRHNHAADAQRAVLGFDLNQLTRRLNQEWHVSPLLDQALDQPRTRGQRTRCVCAGHEIAACVENGWNANALQKLTVKLSREFGIETRHLLQSARENAIEARRDSEIYGAGWIGQLIPQPEQD